MKSLRILFSGLSLLLLISACSSYKECVQTEISDLPEIMPVISLNTDKPVLYRAGFSVLKYQFSGLIAFRKMAGEEEIRIAFISEMGLKLMEFSFMNDEVKNTYCMPVIDKKARIKFVGQFLELILHQPECNDVCQLDKLTNSSYFCNAGREKINLSFKEAGRKEMELTAGRNKMARGNYATEAFLPDTIWVDMKFKTKIQMTKLDNAFN